MKRYILIFVWLSNKFKQKIKTTSGDQNAGRGDRMAEGLVTSRGWETSFAGPGGNSSNPEVRR